MSVYLSSRSKRPCISSLFCSVRFAIDSHWLTYTINVRNKMEALISHKIILCPCSYNIVNPITCEMKSRKTHRFFGATKSMYMMGGMKRSCVQYPMKYARVLVVLGFIWLAYLWLPHFHVSFTTPGQSVNTRCIIISLYIRFVTGTKRQQNRTQRGPYKNSPLTSVNSDNISNHGWYHYSCINMHQRIPDWTFNTLLLNLNPFLQTNHLIGCSHFRTSHTGLQRSLFALPLESPGDGTTVSVTGTSTGNRHAYSLERYLQKVTLG